MVMPKVGTKLAEAMALAIDRSSGPRLATRAGCGTQTIYNVRDGHLPGRLAIPAIARALGLPRLMVTEMVANDRAAREGHASKCELGRR